MTQVEHKFDLISVDDHIIEPATVWVDRLPSRYGDEVPKVVEADGREFWEYEGERLPTMGLNAVAGKEHKDFAMDPVRYSDMIEGVTTRLHALVTSYRMVFEEAYVSLHFLVLPVRGF